MALFGDLEHHALSDLVRVLASQTGTLYFHEAYQGRTLELSLQGGRLRAMYLDGFPVDTPARAQVLLQEVHSGRRGAFEFQRRDGPALVPGLYDLPLAELLQDVDVAVPAEQLPHPDTRFGIVQFGAVQGAVGVPAVLSGTWEIMQPHLAFGASGSELARRVGWAEADVLVALHRLRAAGVVAPLRAAPPPVATLPAVTGLDLPAALSSGAGVGAGTPRPAVHSAPLVQRLLGALRRLTGARA